MLFFILASFRILVFENKVDLYAAVSQEVCWESSFLTLFVAPHLSGPNMITYGDALENSSACNFLLS